MKKSEVDRALHAAVAAGAIPGVVAAVTDKGGVVYRGAFGFADTSTRRELQPNAIFRIASMTKLVTSIAVMQLIEQGLVDVQAPFKRFYPEFRQPGVLQSFDGATLEYTTTPAGHDITVRELLTHTAGYGYWFLNAELGALMAPEPEYYNPPFLMYEPGSRFQYGISTDVLGQLVAPVSGSALAQFFAERIFGPLGMADTGFSLPRDMGRLVSLHRAAMGGGFSADPNERVAEPPRGGGGLYTTADDYLALLRLLLNLGCVDGHRLLAPETVRTMTCNQLGTLVPERQTTAAPQRTADFGFMDGTQQFGFGVLLETHRRPSGRNTGSYGWGGIFNTYFWVDPAAELAAVMCMQMAPFCAPACLKLCDAFEHALYRQLGLRS